jgi:hypothetical protein
METIAVASGVVVADSCVPVGEEPVRRLVVLRPVVSDKEFRDEARFLVQVLEDRPLHRLAVAPALVVLVVHVAVAAEAAVVVPLVVVAGSTASSPGVVASG